MHFDMPFGINIPGFGRGNKESTQHQGEFTDDGTPIANEDILEFAGTRIKPYEYKTFTSIDEEGNKHETILPNYNMWDFLKFPESRVVSDTGVETYKVNRHERFQNMHLLYDEAVDVWMENMWEGGDEVNQSKGGFLAHGEDLRKVLARDHAHAEHSRITHVARATALHALEALALSRADTNTPRVCLNGIPFELKLFKTGGQQISPFTILDNSGKVLPDKGDGGFSGSGMLNITRLDTGKLLKISTLNKWLIASLGFYEGDVIFGVGPLELDEHLGLQADELIRLGHGRGIPEWVVEPMRHAPEGFRV